MISRYFSLLWLNDVESGIPHIFHIEGELSLEVVHAMIADHMGSPSNILLLQKLPSDFPFIDMDGNSCNTLSIDHTDLTPAKSEGEASP